MHEFRKWVVRYYLRILKIMFIKSNIIYLHESRLNFIYQGLPNSFNQNFISKFSVLKWIITQFSYLNLRKQSMKKPFEKLMKNL